MVTKPKSDRELRRFGLVVSGPLTLIAGVLLWRGADAGWYLLAISVALVSGALIRPGLLRPAERAWMWVAEIMGWVMTRVILILSFTLVIVPLGIVLRLMGKD